MKVKFSPLDDSCPLVEGARMGLQRPMQMVSWHSSKGHMFAADSSPRQSAWDRDPRRGYLCSCGWKTFYGLPACLLGQLSFTFALISKCISH